MTPESFLLPANGWVPNNPRLPVLLYRAALEPGPSDETAARLEAMFAKNNWPSQWRDGVYSYHHYHSTAHEALGFAAGSGDLMVGGPQGRQLGVSAGDVIVLPAGTGHCLIEASEDFLVVGAYPRGQTFDTCRNAPTELEIARIAAVGLPDSDPVEGDDGPLLGFWQQS